MKAKVGAILLVLGIAWAAMGVGACSVIIERPGEFLDYPDWTWMLTTTVLWLVPGAGIALLGRHLRRNAR